MNDMPSDSHIEIIARGLLIQEGYALLCRDRKGGYYYLPGGHIEFNEAAAVALAREFKEETGLGVQVGACALITEGAFIQKGSGKHELNLVFHVEHPHPNPNHPHPLPDEVKSKEDHIAFEWVDLAAAVDLDIRPLVIKAWLASGAPVGLSWVSEFAAS